MKQFANPNIGAVRVHISLPNGATGNVPTVKIVLRGLFDPHTSRVKVRRLLHLADLLLIRVGEQLQKMYPPDLCRTGCHHTALFLCCENIVSTESIGIYKPFLPSLCFVHRVDA